MWTTDSWSMAMAMLYKTPTGTFVEMKNARKVTTAAIKGKDGKVFYPEKAEKVTLFGRHYVATQGKNGVPYLNDASKVQMVTGYLVTVTPKGKASFTKFIPEKDVVYTR